MQPEMQTTDTIPLPLLQLDRQAEITSANLKAEEYLGCSSRRLLGKPLADFFSPRHEIKRMLEYLQSADDVSAHGICERLQRRPCSLHLGKGSQGYWAVIVPETQRQELDQMVRRHELAEAMARMALEMAHEIKNPLTSLRGAAQLLFEQAQGENTREVTLRMMAEADRIRDRVDSLLRIGPRRNAPSEPVNPHELILDLGPVPENVSVSYVFDPSLPPITAQRQRLRQALENLWANALEAGATNIEWQTRIAPAAFLPEHKGPVIEIRITNDGASIPAALHEHLFDPYVTSKSRGSGLGLSLVERVMLEHHGRVSFRSERGRTSFILHLPLVVKKP